MRKRNLELIISKCTLHTKTPSKSFYLQAHADAERRIEKGQWQRQCEDCGLWFWEDEFQLKARVI